MRGFELLDYLGDRLFVLCKSEAHIPLAMPSEADTGSYNDTYLQEFVRELDRTTPHPYPKIECCGTWLARNADGIEPVDEQAHSPQVDLIVSPYSGWRGAIPI